MAAPRSNHLLVVSVTIDASISRKTFDRARLRQSTTCVQIDAFMWVAPYPGPDTTG
jgi:hypothetical protein